MKSLILVKSHPCVQVAHLYEHLFLRAVNDKFYDRKLYKSLDYHSHGATYPNSGTVLFDCDFFSEVSKELIESILKLRIDLGDEYDNLYTALWQMSAELSYKLESSSFEDLVTELKQLDQHEWNNIDDISWIKTKESRRKTTPLYITHVKANPKKINISLQIDKTLASSNPELLPLYYIVSRMTLYNLNTRLASKFGIYEAENITINPNHLKATSILWSFPRNSAKRVKQEDLEVLMIYSKAVISEIYSDETFFRLIKDLSDISYSNNILHTPNYEEILETTHVLMGSKGWIKIATIDNIKKVLSSIDLEFKIGRLKLAERIKL